MTLQAPLGLFEGFGIELEYMIVDAETLSAKPVADHLLYTADGGYESEVEMGELCWSNELVLHVIELKTNGPSPRLEGLAVLFQEHIGHINRLLEPLGARLMPTAMHPWFDPARETRLWPHAYSPVYEAYNRIFDCRGHGWSNLQSAHINLPFGSDSEFGRLHAAIRLLLPIMPALAASSPIVDLRDTGCLDSRLDMYGSNSARIPSIAGNVIPESVFTQAEYDRDIFQPMYRDITPHDPAGILRHEFLNSRGAIARFSRQSIEIRVLDIQESPVVDLAIARAIIAVVKGLTGERWVSYDRQKLFGTMPLTDLYRAVVCDGERALISDPDYLEAMGVDSSAAVPAADVWRELIARCLTDDTPGIHEARAILDTILTEGPLARRILRAVGNPVRRDRVAGVYRELCDCLAEGRRFHA
jgi:glutamate---cysteine ligase / carboxylate-amine ligase